MLQGGTLYEEGRLVSCTQSPAAALCCTCLLSCSTGQCYSSASVFEGRTTKRRNKKVESSFKVVRGDPPGMPQEMLRTWYEHELGHRTSFRMEKPPKEAAWRVKHWYHGMLRLAGADIDEAADAATLALEARQQRAARTLPQPHT